LSQAAGDSAVVVPPPPMPAPVVGFFGNVWQGTVNFFSQEVPFAILVTLGIFAIAGLIGSQITITHPTQFASLPGYSEGAAGYAHAGSHEPRVPPAPPAPKVPEPQIPEVAQITGMVDCEWSDTLAPMHHRIGIGHNNKFALSKGIMEITYYTGAKVILQGPCTYEIDSASGGYLSLGKLTARIEKGARGVRRDTGTVSKNLPSFAGGGAGGEGRSESAGPSALTQVPSGRHEGFGESRADTSHPLPDSSSLFAVRTPTAVITDLGTEFGVEVEKNGETTSLVFSGKVELRRRVGGRVLSKAISLSANESARVSLDVNEEITVSREIAEPHRFVRATPRAPRILLTDDAASYKTGWRNASWSGQGWGSVWDLILGNENNACGIDHSGSIDTDGKSFCTTTVRGMVEAKRDFVFRDLPVGAIFSIDFANGPVPAGHEYNAGFGLHNAAGDCRFEFGLLGEQGTEYHVWSSYSVKQPTGIPYTEKGLHIELTRTSLDGYQLKVVRLEDNSVYNISGKFLNASSGSDICRFRHWNHAMRGGGVSRAYFNSIRVTFPQSQAGEQEKNVE